MTLNLECVRAVMLELEETPYGGERSAESVIDALSKFTSEEIKYSLLKLLEAGFIDAHLFTAWGVFPYVDAIYDITYNGHEFLNSIRANKVWSKTKAILSDVGTGSVSFAFQIATGVLTELIKQYTLTP